MIKKPNMPQISLTGRNIPLFSCFRYIMKQDTSHSLTEQY